MTIKALLQKHKNPEVWIGVDSKSMQNEIHYALSLVIVDRGNGAFSYWRKLKLKKFMSTYERLFQEVIFAIELASLIKKVTDKYRIPLEVHLDLNPKPVFMSYQVYKDAAGYLKSLGIPFRCKPEAIASTVCANKHL